jgi:hypothetical protein
MYIWINDVKKLYSYINNKDITYLLDLHKIATYRETVTINWAPRECKFFLKTDIENLFWKINNPQWLK